MSITKEQVLADALRLARAKQGKEAEKCVELTAETKLASISTNVMKNSAIDDVAKELASKYDVTFPSDVRSLGTIDDVAEYIVDNTDR